MKAIIELNRNVKGFITWNVTIDDVSIGMKEQAKKLIKESTSIAEEFVRKKIDDNIKFKKEKEVDLEHIDEAFPPGMLGKLR